MNKEGIILVFLFLLFGSCRSQVNSSVRELKIVNKKIVPLLEKVYMENKFIKEDDRLFYVIKVEDSSVVKIGVESKSGFAKNLVDSKEKIRGYFEYKDRQVLVFGNKDKTLFSKSKNKQKIDYLVVGKEESKDSLFKNIPAPKDEDVVWTYKKVNDDFKLVKAQYSYILDYNFIK